MHGRGYSGTTLVEVLVAVVVLTVGLLGLLGSTVTVARMVEDGRRSQRTVALATGRLEMLRSQPCASLSDGWETSGAYTLAWTVTRVANARQAVVAVTSPRRAGERIDLFHTVIACGP